MFRTSLAACVAAGGLLAAGSAGAATVLVNQTLNLPDDLQIQQRLFTALATPVEVASGDTVDITIDFAGDQEIVFVPGGQVGDMFVALIHFGPGSVVHVSNTGTLSFLNLAGDAIYTTPENIIPDDCCQFAGATISNFGALPSPFRFGGVRYVGTVDFAEGGPYLQDTAAFDISADFTLEGVGGVPEPAAWALMLAGFGLAGSAVRRDRRRQIGA